ncbi:fungal-specific transcription factor domain-containing protein [Trametes elegans]|nr:fungal-specific transcription factor domain-containing protein [Trametes elegans]
MSSSDEAERAAAHPAAAAQKKRKMVQRACDSCRRKKIGCDGARTANRRCSRCTARGIECTYADPFYKSQYPEGYVESLENRIKRMEEVITRLSSNTEAGGAPDRESTHRASPRSGYRNIAPSSSGAASPAFRTYPPSAASPTTAHDRDADADDEDLSDQDGSVSSDVLQRLSDLSLDPMVMRYWGKSSGLTFVCTTLGIREQYLSEITPETAREKLSPKKLFDTKLRSHAWLDISPVEEPIAVEKFPPADLMDELVESYFRQSNDFLPLLHEPTFRAGIKQNLHLRVPGFGCTVLLVCAFGARFSDDPRVLLDGTSQWQSAGWKWYKVVDDRHKSWLAPAHLYDLQSCVLMALYMYGSSTPHLTWTIVGIGMRKALDVGAHRKGMYHPTPTVEDELWRRAFWALVVLEWGGSHGLGRPPCIYDEEFDLTLPTECDDEYWTNPDPEKAFKQPPDKPSKVTFFIHYIELARLITHATRTIYSLGKSRARLGSDGPQWEEKVVAELDSEMNYWLDRVPEHLRWDPDREDELFLSQSGAIYAHFYQVQISVHRSFITSRKGDPLSLASLIICTNAARSCVQVLEKVTNRIGTPNHRNGVRTHYQDHCDPVT